MGEMNWALRMRGMDIRAFREVTTQLCDGVEGITVEVELEEADCMTAFFTLASEDGESVELEVSVYDLGRDGRILAVEDDCSDNGEHWDRVCELGEALAERLGGELIDDD